MRVCAANLPVVSVAVAGRRGEQAGRQHSVPLSRGPGERAFLSLLEWPVTRDAGPPGLPVPGTAEFFAPSISEGKLPRRRTTPSLPASQLATEAVLRFSNWGFTLNGEGSARVPATPWSPPVTRGLWLPSPPPRAWALPDGPPEHSDNHKSEGPGHRA